MLAMLAIVLIVALINLIIGYILFKNYSDKTSKSSYEFESLEKSIERITKNLSEEMSKSREENSNNDGKLRKEIFESINSFGNAMSNNMKNIATLQKNQLDAFSDQLSKLTQLNEQRLEGMRKTVENRLKILQDDNSQKLEQMRATVDEKLHSTLERRLGESFKLVSDRLELVHKGLGEMHTLATGVGDLKKVLTNVKTRGTWGEIQLGNLLDELLTREQYETNITTKKGSKDTVEFAIKLPGRAGKVIYLPIDAKFPKDDYERLIEAQEQANIELAEELGKALENRIKIEAKSIKDKYIDPPHTTDFAILFLPTEGLYAEVIRRPGLCDRIQREYRVTVAGPTNILAFLNSLQMGFKTLAIEKRASEVWDLLSAVKTEFGKFGEILEKTQKKLEEAANTIENAAKKSRTIERKLKDVQSMPNYDEAKLLEDIEEGTLIDADSENSEKGD